MAKRPVAGAVKSRLAGGLARGDSGIGTVGATRFYRTALRHTLVRLGTDPRWQTYLAVSPGSALMEGCWPSWPFYARPARKRRSRCAHARPVRLSPARPSHSCGQRHSRYSARPYRRCLPAAWASGCGVRSGNRRRLLACRAEESPATALPRSRACRWSSRAAACRQRAQSRKAVLSRLPRR